MDSPENSSTRPLAASLLAALPSASLAGHVHECTPGDIAVTLEEQADEPGE